MKKEIWTYEIHTSYLNIDKTATIFELIIFSPDWSCTQVENDWKITGSNYREQFLVPPIANPLKCLDNLVKNYIKRISKLQKALESKDQRKITLIQ